MRVREKLDGRKPAINDIPAPIDTQDVAKKLFRFLKRLDPSGSSNEEVARERKKLMSEIADYDRISVRPAAVSFKPA